MAIPQLVLGAFNLTDWTGSAYQTSVIVEGTSKGAPVPLEVAVKTWLQDGSIVLTQGYDNRTVTLRVRMRASSLTAVSQAEAALNLELGKPNTLTWTPASGPATVFDVVTSSMEEAPGEAWDLAEAYATPWRSYNVRLLCLASNRSASKVTSVSTAPGGATTTSLDTCGATTGWTGSVDGVSATVTSAAGPPTTIAVTSSALTGSHTVSLAKTFAATTSTTNLLVVDWLPTPVTDVLLTASGDGVALDKVGEGPSPTSGYTRTWFKVAASTLAVTQLNMSTNTGFTSSARTLRVDNVSVTNVAPVLGSNRQQIRVLTLAGSTRAQGSLAIESTTAALGDALVYVCPRDDSTTGYVPAMRQFRSGGNTVTPDATKVSGATEPLGASTVSFRIPVGNLPQGSYLLMARLADSSGGTRLVNYNTSTNVGSTTMGSTPGSVSLALTTSYQNFVLGRVQLPTADLDPNSNSAGAVVTLALSSVSTASYDEVWLFNTTIGALVSVACGTGSGSVGGPSRRLFIEPASVDTPRPTVRVGHSSDRSDSFFTTPTSWQQPVFQPPLITAFVVTSGATDATVSLSYYPRWHTNAAS